LRKGRSQNDSAERASNELLRTHKDIGSVAEVFRMSHRGKSESLMQDFAGRASIGHVRYATCGRDDVNYAQPFDRKHIQRFKCFSMAFNGQLSNYRQLKKEMMTSGEDYHLSLDSDTEIIMFEICRELSRDPRPDSVELMKALSARFDGAYCLAILNGSGELLIARDPLGIKPMCYAHDDLMFAAASESVALLNLGFRGEDIRSLAPGHVITVDPNGVRVEAFASNTQTAHCFFEWIYFANVASTLDNKSVYVSRTNLGVELGRLERQSGEVLIDENTIVVPVPDTSKAAADAMAFELKIPSREGLIRNRYSGRTFIESGDGRKRKAETKYTPLREVLEGKRVFLVEDSIVRSTTMKVLIERLYEIGKAAEIHVRVACPPIMAPCFYGIDMSTINELFAPRFLKLGLSDEEMFARMADELGCDSLRYLPVESVARSIGLPRAELCQACITGAYPTPWGGQLYEIAKSNAKMSNDQVRTFECDASEVELASHHAG
jgi:amidophosphoribosyltransferase